MAGRLQGLCDGSPVSRHRPCTPTCNSGIGNSYSHLIDVVSVLKYESVS